MSIKKITINSLVWSFLEKFLNQGIYFTTTIILARLLSPAEFGVAALLSIILSISEVLINGGFSDALIRRKDATLDDYSTIFIFNIIASVIIYLTIFISSDFLSTFFDYSNVKVSSIIKVFSIIILINSFGFIRMTILRKELLFKKITLILIISGVISGVFAILLAANGFGIWSLIAKSIINSTAQLFLLFFFVKRRISVKFNLNSFKSMFSFSARILGFQLINTIFNDVYIYVIGKFFGAATLGQYNVAKRFCDIPTKNLNTIIQNVTYPLLSKIRNDGRDLSTYYRKIINYTMCFNIVLTTILFTVSDELVWILLGDKWVESADILRLLVFSTVFIPAISLNSNILKVKGRVSIILRLSILNKFLVAIVLFIGIQFGLNTMLMSLIIVSIIDYLLNSYYGGKTIEYFITNQLIDIIPYVLVGLVICAISIVFDHFIILGSLLMFILKISVESLVTILLFEFFSVNSYKAIKNIIGSSLYLIYIRIFNKVNSSNT